MMPSPQAATGPLARGYGALVVAFRYLIVVAWIAAIAGAVRYLPALAPAGGVASLVPPNAPALQAEATATRTFGEPLDAEVAIVQRAAHGLSTNVQVSAAAQRRRPGHRPRTRRADRGTGRRRARSQYG